MEDNVYYCANSSTFSLDIRMHTRTKIIFDLGFCLCCEHCKKGVEITIIFWQEIHNDVGTKQIWAFELEQYGVC